MKTYQLSANSKPRLKELSKQKRVKRFAQMKFRAIALVTGEFTEDELSDVQVCDVYEGDSFDALLPWISTNVLEELLRQTEHRTYTERQKKLAMADWANAQNAVAEAERALQEAQDALKTSSRKLITVMGKSPISFNGEIYDPSYTRETVRYHRRVS